MATTSQASVSELDSPNKEGWHMPFSTRSNSKVSHITSYIPSNRVVSRSIVKPNPYESNVSNIVPTNNRVAVVTDGGGSVEEPHNRTASSSPVPTDRVVVELEQPHGSISLVPLNNLAIDVVEPQPSFSNFDPSSLIQLVKQKNLNQLLVEYEGIAGVANALRTNLRTGIYGGDEDQDISHRREAFGTNMYPKPPTKRFWRFVWEALENCRILTLFICAVLSLGLDIKERLGQKEWWYDGVSIFGAAILLVLVSATSSFWQERLFVKLSKTSNTNIPVHVVRNGRRQQVRIFEIVVGDVVFLQIGDQVPADVKRIMACKVMVRNPSVCETMGTITTICTETTGILTLNQMKLMKFWLGQESVDERVSTPIADSVRELLYQGVGLNTRDTFCDSHSGSEFEFSDEPIEKAILSWAVKELNMDLEELKQNYTILHVEPFNSTMKRRGISIGKMVDNTINVHWKGAPEIVLSMCSHYYDISGNIKALNDDERHEIDQIIQGMANSGLRCIAFAHKQVLESDIEDEGAQGNIMDNCLTLLALVGIKDLHRPCVKSHVKELHYSGVNIKVITGDNVFTARAIATECGILRPNQDINSGAVVEGEEFRNYTAEERLCKVDKICVMARSSPFDKLLMVQCLKQRGHVVAVTGDGMNDALALKEADIGLSMGIQGTEVAKESSDIVILDDHFGSVVTVMKWGRCVYNNIQKFIQFQLTVNVAALVIYFVTAVSAGQVPLTLVQLLWVNLIMDTLGALALATEKPSKELMEKPPLRRFMPLITNIMWRNLLAQALYQIAVLLTLQFRGKSIFGVNMNVNDTLIFNTFVLCQVFNKFNARKLEKRNVFEGIHKSKLFLAIIGITIVLQVVMVEFLKKFASTERLNLWQWGVCIGFAAVSWPLGWLVKWIPVPEKPFFSYLKWRNTI
ncbi:Calcium-transporting ATPase 12, plasma membrane-type [Camellia lanceoleosa]|uniref:Calcium-transporting ATPase 12, plasma membrane-type n=1 Tax=Camellia lanceoleosa TaxID=1840588 RepID=A0ACC0HBX6_9ERIC|nr:Calcium-transporting ATPase 12, plasma membrane-type [Camellia lanceoleosa]